MIIPVKQTSPELLQFCFSKCCFKAKTKVNPDTNESIQWHDNPAYQSKDDIEMHEPAHAAEQRTDTVCFWTSLSFVLLMHTTKK